MLLIKGNREWEALLAAMSCDPNSPIFYKQ